VGAPEFVTVARADDLEPGTITTVRARDAQVALARVGDDFYALTNECAHLKGPVGEGRLDGCVVGCPWHGWQYDVRTGRNVFDLAIGIRTYEVRVEDGNVQVAV
jgi:nitrite reductase (NADH) small subunit